MSRWLNSVNSLLEQFDGQAENVANNSGAASEFLLDGAGSALGSLIEKAKTASTPLRGRNATATSSISEEYYSTDDDDDNIDSGDYDDDEDEEEEEDEYEDYEAEIVIGDDGEEYYEEEVTGTEDGGFDDDDDDDPGTGTEDEDMLSSSREGGADSGGGPLQSQQLETSQDEEEEAISIGIPTERRMRLNSKGSMVDEDAVSDISFSEHLEEEQPPVPTPTVNVNKTNEEDQVLQNNDKKNNDDEGEYLDFPPKSPNRQHSTKKNLVEASAARALGKTSLLVGPTIDAASSASVSPPAASAAAATTTDAAALSTAVAAPPPSKQSVTRKSPSSGDKLIEKFDMSPRPPRRSLNEVGLRPTTTEVEFWDAELNGKEGGVGGNVNTPVPAAAFGASQDPPKIPTRQASHNQTEAPVTDPTLSLQRAIARTQTPDTTGTSSQDNNFRTFDSKLKSPPSKKGADKSSNNSNDATTKALSAKVQALQAQVKKMKNDLKTSQAEGKQFEKTVKTLTAKLETADAEINAQREELLRAGERMEKDRQRAQTDREDLLDDHEDEVDQMKELHDTAMAEQKTQYEAQIQELQSRISIEESRRMQEGGDWNKELKDAIQREKDALVKLNQIEAEKQALQSANSKLEIQQTALQTKIESSLSAAKTAAERERQVEDKLDATLSLHARQMSQRQAREAELEGTIFELGSALTLARQQQLQTAHNTAQAGHHHGGANNSPEETANFKDQYEQAVEELDTVKVQFEMETQRREALQQELNEISKERTEEASSAQAKQRQHDRKVADLESTITRLQESIRGLKRGNSSTAAGGLVGGGGGGGSPELASTTDDQVTQLIQQIETSKVEIAQLSEQLLRQQDRVDACKTEILALKGRLEAATTRAEEAEKALYAETTPDTTTTSSTTTGRIYEMEGGGLGLSNPGVRRRVKGGSSRLRGGSSSSARSIRSALRMTTGRTSPAMEQVAMTLDALDAWMVDTGSFLRHEPLARLGFLLYLMTLHLWSFALVVFHTTEQPHADFGSLGNNPRNWRPPPSQPQP